MESKYSKGTWFAKDGEIYETETGKTIALIPYYDDEDEEQVANAKLIEAIPSLLEACEDVIEELQRTNATVKDILSYNIGRLGQVIYEATGE